MYDIRIYIYRMNIYMQRIYIQKFTIRYLYNKMMIIDNDVF